MKAIVSVQTFDEGSKLSLVTSCGARVNQVLRSNSKQSWMNGLASRRLILEIKPDVARVLLGLVKVGEAHHSSWRLPSSIVSELKHFLELFDGKRNENEGSGQSCEAEGAARPEEKAEGDSRRPDQPKERIRLVHNLQTGEEVVLPG
jgi:hypothetical protein